MVNAHFNICQHFAQVHTHIWEYKLQSLDVQALQENTNDAAEHLQDLAETRKSATRLMEDDFPDSIADDQDVSGSSRNIGLEADRKTDVHKM